MADVTLTSVRYEADGLHLIGTNFTKTTSTVWVDQLESPFTFVSSTELVIDTPAPGSTVEVEKDNIYSEAITTEEQPKMSDQSPTQSPSGFAPISAEDCLTEQEKSPNSDPVGEPQPLGPLAELVKTGAKEPYPSGSPAVEPKAKTPMNEAPVEEEAPPATGA